MSIHPPCLPPSPVTLQNVSTDYIRNKLEAYGVFHNNFRQSKSECAVLCCVYEWSNIEGGSCRSFYILCVMNDICFFHPPPPPHPPTPPPPPHAALRVSPTSSLDPCSPEKHPSDPAANGLSKQHTHHTALYT